MKTIYYVTTLFFLLLSQSLFAQDVITLKNGNEIKSIVSEVTVDAVKYKKYENQQGLTYTMLKSEIFMIKYENGQKDTFKDTQPATKKEEIVTETKDTLRIDKKTDDIYLGKTVVSKDKLKSVLITDSEAYKIYSSGKNMKTTGTVMIFVGGGASVISFIALGSSPSPTSGQIALNVGLIGVDITGLILYYVGKGKIKKSFKVYNSNLKNKKNTSYNFDFGVTNSGVGLTLNF